MSKPSSEALSTPEPPSSKTDFSHTQNDQQNNSSDAKQEPPTVQENSHKPGITFAGQDKLPKLPIPELQSTCKKYLDALKPLQNSHEQEDTEDAVQEFLQHEGPELQARLRKYATGKTSYIEQFWYDSFLNFDNPVVLNLNPFFLFEDDPTPARNNQVTRAASLVISALSFVRAVRKEELLPDKFRGNPLCMYQHSRLFGTARVPTDHGCHIAQDSGAKHIVVLCRGQFYWFDVLDDASDLIMTEKDMALNLQVVVDDAEETPVQEAAKGALGVLSTENRKIWAGLRDVLTRDPESNNAECLGIVDSSLFILCLDYTAPQTGAELCGNMLCGTNEIVKGVQIGTCTNRWYDKLQIIVCKNGSAGINFEHTGVDGHTVLRMASDVYTDTILRYAKSINGQAPSLWASTSPDPAKRAPDSFGDVCTTPHKLEWDMLPELSTAVRFAETRLADLIHQHELETLDFAGYGKNFIVSMGISPDAFVQMAFQAAYYGLYGQVENTYEPAMTKIFLHGRTEAIRAVTPESVRFVQTFWGEHPLQQKVEALRKATQQHTRATKECAKALGQDRHLYALYCVWQRAVDDEGAEAASSSSSDDPGSSDSSSDPADADADSVEPGGFSGRVATAASSDQRPESPPAPRAPPPPAPKMPALFADAGWDKINHTILSTSNCGNPSLRQFGFGPTSEDGFGIGYIIKDDSIAICVSSKHRQTKRFIDALESYLLEIRKLLRNTTQRKSKSPMASRVRETEENPVTTAAAAASAAAERGVKGRGRAITGESSGARMSGEIAAEDSKADSDDDGLGGYGFFDAGMLLQVLKASRQQEDKKDRLSSDNTAHVARRAIGKKLRLGEYG